MKHLLSIETLAWVDIQAILADTVNLKKERGRHVQLPLAGQTWALLFSKSSTRTRVSFEVGIRELGGQAIFLPASEIQLGRGEPIKDTARVLGRMVHGVVIRTFRQQDVEEFAEFSNIPTITAPSSAPSRRATSRNSRTMPPFTPSTPSRTTSILAKSSRTSLRSRKSAAPSGAKWSRSSATAPAT